MLENIEIIKGLKNIAKEDKSLARIYEFAMKVAKDDDKFTQQTEYLGLSCLLKIKLYEQNNRIIKLLEQGNKRRSGRRLRDMGYRRRS